MFRAWHMAPINAPSCHGRRMDDTTSAFTCAPPSGLNQKLCIQPETRNASSLGRPTSYLRLWVA